jgi:hypothetical protein
MRLNETEHFPLDEEKIKSRNPEERYDYFKSLVKRLNDVYGKIANVVNHNAPGDLSEIINLIYPVGSIYISINATNPETLFGVGTWVAFGAGKVLVGLDAGQAEFDTVEETGGEKTHTLSIAEMPPHAHDFGGHLYWYEGGGNNVAGNTLNIGFKTATASAGGGSAHNNLQPYIVVYMWKRTA